VIRKSKIQNVGWFMELENLAKRIRERCIETVLQAYEDAGIQGLCAEGRWEAAVDALRTVELAPLLRELEQSAH
jgi:hypothetical protein